MRIIHVLRKPLVEASVAANVLKHGTGALNIDRTRIGAEVRTYHGSGASPQKLDNHGPGDTGVGLLDGRGRQIEFTVTGRWPANLILEHRPACQRKGTRRVAGNRVDTRPEGDAGRADRSQWRFRPTESTRRGYSDDEGMETIEAWDCVPGCPVTELDVSVGLVHARGNKSPTVHTGVNMVYGEYGPVTRDEDHWRESGHGFVSRFFKQVGRSKK